VCAAPVRGTVLIKSSGSGGNATPRGDGYTELVGDTLIPVGSLVDSSRGRVRITAALPGDELQSSDFYQGVFQVLQSRRGLATMELAGGGFARCPGADGGRAARTKVVRELGGSGSGRFRTRGRNSSATVRGTIWSTIDRCDGTLTIVRRGAVVVRDFRKKETIIVKAGEQYLARSR
jgi:hypothetical protein